MSFFALALTILIPCFCALSSGAVSSNSNPSEPVSQQLISKPVGEVNGHIVTSREVQLNYLIERALMLPPGKFAEQEYKLDVGSSSFRRELNGVFLEWVVELQAKTMALAELAPDDVKRALDLTKVIAKTEVWKDVKASSDEIREAVMRKLRAKKFIKQKAESSLVEPTDEEVREFYERNREQFPFSFESRIEQLRQAKRRKDANDRLQDWFRNLQQQYKVRSYLAPR